MELGYYTVRVLIIYIHNLLQMLDYKIPKMACHAKGKGISPLVRLEKKKYIKIATYYSAIAQMRKLPTVIAQN